MSRVVTPCREVEARSALPTAEQLQSARIALHRWLVPCLLALVTACGQAKDEPVPVTLSGLNYTDVPSAYFSVSNPENPKAGGVNGLITSRAGGGQSSGNCCISIPAKWRPGLKVLVKYRFDTMPADHYATKVLELPPYVDSKPAELWVVFYSTSDLDIHVVDATPTSQNWPGRLKAWPDEVSPNEIRKVVKP